MTPYPTRRVPYYGWTIVALAFMMQALGSGATNSLYGVFALPFSQSFDASRAQVMLATASVAMIASGILSPLAGLWLQRYRRRPLILAGGAALALGFVAVSQATALWQISVIYFFCWSLGTTLFGPLAANTSVSYWFVARRGKALGFASIGMSMGTIILPPLVSWIIVQHSWQSACLFLGALIACSLPLIAVFYRESPAAMGLALDGQGEDDDLEESKAMTMKEVLKTGNFWIIAACISICFACFNGMTVNLVPMAVDQGVSQQQAAFLLSISAAFGIIGKLLSGISADRLGPRTALTLPLISIALACLVLLGHPSFARMVVGAVFLGLAAGGAIPAWGALIGSFFGRQSFSLVMGLMNPMLVPLIVLSAPFISWTQEHFGSYNLGLFVIIGFAALAMILAPLLRHET